MDTKTEIKRIIKSSKAALLELDKLINQKIDLNESDPEKTKINAQGKIEAIEGSFKIIQLIQEQEAKLEEKEEDKKPKKDFFGVESKIK